MKATSAPIRVQQCREELQIGETLMSAILRAMFPDRQVINGRVRPVRRVVKQDVIDFMRKNPTFSQTEVYRKKEVATS
jgi:ferric iron reductase protein FhuF